MKFTKTLALFAIASAAATLPVQAQTGSFDRTLQIFGPVNLDVSSASGNITVRTGAKDSVHVVAKIHAQNSWADWLSWLGMSAEDEIRKLESNPPIEQQGNSIRIGHIEEWWHFNHISIDYDLTVPPQTALISHTGSGDQSISGLQLASAASCGSGTIAVENIDANVRLRSGSGDLKADSVKGLDAETGSGSIRATRVAGDVAANAGSGRIEIEQVVTGAARIGTGSGDVTLRGAKGPLKVQTASGEVHVEGEPDADWHIGTASGSIGLKLASQASFNLDATTISGSLRTDRALTVQGLTSRTHLQGKVGNGGALLEAHTVSGDIEID
jgi:putative adhesin